jgi:hypothetical protein
LHEVEAMSRVRAADDFEAIRLRLEEIRRERGPRYGSAPMAEKPIQESDAAALMPRHIVRRYLADARRSSSR